jgi:hypothetical protein
MRPILVRATVATTGALPGTRRGLQWARRVAGRSAAQSVSASNGPVIISHSEARRELSLTAGAQQHQAYRELRDDAAVAPHAGVTHTTREGQTTTRGFNTFLKVGVGHLFWKSRRKRGPVRPELDLTGGAWLSDRVLVSVAVRPRSFSPSSSALHPGRSASGFCRSTNVPDEAVPHCTTKLENTHGTEFRELLYPWHPWFGLRIGVHAAIERSSGTVFRCSLSGSDADRWLEVPAPRRIRETGRGSR